jgi:3-deoxy-D-manno-octulosonic-acid transferase
MLLSTPLLPAWMLATAIHPRWRRGWAHRWGLRLPLVSPGAIWVHAASVGEVTAAAALVRRLSPPVLLTADTDTGVARAEQLLRDLPGVAVGPKPVDHPWTLAPLWAEARPRALVFVEGTWWRSLARLARTEGVPILRVSARAGPRSRALAGLLRAWTWPVELVLARDADAAAFFSRLHPGAAVQIAGDLKEDAPLPPPLLRWSRPFAVVASARPGDTARTLQAMDQLGLQLQLLVAPRHPERFDLAELGARSFARRTALSTPQVPDSVEVLLLDTVGELSGCLQGARFAVIGGTFDPDIGGHSPLEARRAGVPVVAGPHVHAQGGAFEGTSVGEDLAAQIAQARPGPAPSGGVAERVAAEVAQRAVAAAPERSPRPWAAPLGWAVGAVSSWRQYAHDRGWRAQVAMPVPVISIGSTNARSPGRTSTVRALVGWLLGRGERVGVALRGYRRPGGGRQVHLSSELVLVGDEGALLAAVGARVAAGPDRVAAARRLVEDGATVILLDDGLAARELYRDLDLAVVDARFPQARGMLPAGERRERESVPARAHLVLVHHGGGLFAYPGLQVRRVPTPWTPRPPEGPVAALAGIGRPADFLASLEVPVARFLALPDHGAIDAQAVLAWAGPLPVVCTAKDAVRLPELLRPRAHWRDVEIELPAPLLARLSDLLR